MRYPPIAAVVRRCIRKATRDHTGAYAAKAALFWFLSIFPLALLLLELIRFLPFSQEQVYGFCATIFPDTVMQFVGERLQELYAVRGGTALTLTALTTLWTASKGFYAILQGLDIVYDVPRRRRYVLLRLVSMVYTVVFLLCLTALLGILLFGDHVWELVCAQFPQPRGIAWGLFNLRYLSGAGILVLLFWLMYRTLPHHTSRRTADLPGAVLCAGGWIGFSYLFGFYIDRFGNYAVLYGSLTAVMVLALWLYACMYMVLIGAHVNVLWQDGRFHRATPWPPQVTS